MAKFDVPAPKTIYPLDISNIGGCDEYSTTPLVSRSPDMRNIINRLGMHQVRANIEQTYIVSNYSSDMSEDDDLYCNIKWIGKIEEYDDLGNPVPYYIKISEFLGNLNDKDKSHVFVSVWPTPDVRNIKYNMNNMPGCEKYIVSYKKFTFTNYGETGNERGLYESINFNGKTYVFTPVGILSFNCFDVEENDKIRLDFTVDNVLNDPYVPTITIGSKPNGNNRETYEPINLLTNKRKASFISDGTSTYYELPEKVIKNITSVKQLNADGTYTTLNNYTWNNILGEVVFTTAPAATPTAGMDNLIIEYEKSPNEGNETNQFSISNVTYKSFLQGTVNVTKATNQDDSSKIDISMNIKVSKGTGYKSNNNLTNANITITAGSIEIYNHTFTSAEINVIKNGTFSFDYICTINNDGATNSRNWALALNCDVTTTTTTTWTTGVQGSVGANVNAGTSQGFYGSTWKMGIDTTASAHLGSATNGSDSYWEVWATPYIYCGTAGSISASSKTMWVIIDGVEVGSTETGQLSKSKGYESYWRGNTMYRVIPYSDGKTSINVWGHCNFTVSGIHSGEVYTGDAWTDLPRITLNTYQTHSSTSTTSSNDGGVTNYAEGIKHTSNTSNISYENDAKKSARLSCYYSVHASTVYGFENDRRVFVTNGSNTDTFSGLPVDENYSTISYFPDTNYRVLGEDANILGYAQKQGYLFTIKEGADSIYIRKATTLNDEVQFPSVQVVRNKQVLCKPIEVESSVFLITRNGLEELSYDSIYNYTYELKTFLRSYYISNYFDLGSDYKYKQMEWYYENGLLHVFLDNYSFVFDLNSKSYVKELSSSTGSGSTTGLPYQFEAYVCTIPDLNANKYAPHVNVFLPKDFERKTFGIVYTDVLPYGYSNTGIYKFSHEDNKVDILKEIRDNEIITKYYPIQAHYVTPFLDFNTITQLKTTKQIHINTAGNNNDEYYIGYILPDGEQVLLDKIINSTSDTLTNMRNGKTVFPKIIAIRNKIRKFTDVKLFIKNKADYENIETISEDRLNEFNNLTFNRISMQYVIAGKYRGD